MSSYRDLAVWQRAVDLAVDLYRVTQSYPTHELYGLTSQTRRAVTSISANIAEGRSRGTSREFHRFVGIALGSLAEVETHLVLAERLGYVEAERGQPLLQECSELSRMLGALRRSLRRKQEPLANSPSNP